MTHSFRLNLQMPKLRNILPSSLSLIVPIPQMTKV